MNRYLRLLFIVCLQGILGLQEIYAVTYYVSTSGSDSNNGTSQSTPFRSINKGVSSAQANGDIVYVMTGTYNEAVTIRQSGITLSAFPNNTPVIDGGTSQPSYDWGALILLEGNYNKVSGFEVKNSNINGSRKGGHGIWMGGHHNTVSKMNVHHTWAVPILAEGDYSIVEDSQVWQGTRSNGGGTSGGWGTGLSAARNRTAAAIKPGINSYSILRRNRVFNNWGEGLSCYEADHCTLEDNIVYDNWTNNLYISDSTNSLVQRNIIYISSNPAINFRNSTHTGITLADELSHLPRSANNTIINNFLYNVDLGAFFWTLVSGSGLRNVLIANNTIVDGNLLTGSGGGSNITNTNSQIRNNIILSRNSSVPSSSGITFSNNNWAATPSAANAATNVGGDPQIARAGAVTAGNLTAAYFKISGSSPVINAATPLTSVGADFFGTSRGNAPDIGAHEFTTASSAPAPAPSTTSPTTPAPAPAATPAPAPAPAPGNNLALNKPVTVSSTETADSRGSYDAKFAVDGNSGTRWSSAFSGTQWISIDLGSRKQINRVLLNWEVAYGKSYNVQVSEDNQTWTNIYSTTTGDGGTDDLSVSGAGRYIRIYGTVRGTIWGYSLYEIGVYGTDTPLSLNRPVTVSSTQAADPQVSYNASYAVDGNSSSRWSSAFADPQWITVDLGISRQIHRVVLNWEVAYGKAYNIQVSEDNQTWTNIYSTTTGDGGMDDLSVSGKGRYVRMYGTTRGTKWGYSLYEMNVYGQ